ncbi:Uncharacterized protein OBRU01_11035 [Operophtera brumata]|uniref:Uncharacterized protein n=1 Tax=Operophtera brumata TaxID=104452 RepID=A0A0L7KZQ6_OPEBR|nr:Uncharacterized protein OBRU01_11035 [Operophtera brumata]
MKPGKSVDVREEIAEVHVAARSPSPKQKPKPRSRSRSGSRKLSNGLVDAERSETPKNGEPSSEKSKRDSWIKSEHESVELPIHDQINQGIMAFVEKEIKKSDKNPAFVFYSHDPNGLDEKFVKTLSRPSSGHKEKRNEVVTLSGELEIEPNDVENNNGTSKELRHKPRKTRRRTRDERQDTNTSGKDVSPKVFKAGTMLQTLESTMPYHEQYIDNPFSSPSPVTSPNDERLDPFKRRPEKIYMQGGGTFRAVSRDRILESQHFAPACHGILGGLALMHLLLISYSDGLDAGTYLHSRSEGLAQLRARLPRHPRRPGAHAPPAHILLRWTGCRLDVTSMDLSRGLQPYFQPIVLVILYTACLLVCTTARMYDDLMVYQYAPAVANVTGNGTAVSN